MLVFRATISYIVTGKVTRFTGKVKINEHEETIETGFFYVYVPILKRLDTPDAREISKPRTPRGKAFIRKSSQG